MQGPHHIHKVSYSIRAKSQKQRLLLKFELLRKQRGYSYQFLHVMCLKQWNRKCVKQRELNLTSGGWSRATRHPLVHPLSLSALCWPLTSGWEGDVSQELESLLFPASSLLLLLLSRCPLTETEQVEESENKYMNKASVSHWLDHRETNVPWASLTVIAETISKWTENYLTTVLINCSDHLSSKNIEHACSRLYEFTAFLCFI